MKGNVIGVREVNFTNPDTGELIQGKKIFVAADDVDTFGKFPYSVWVGNGTPLETKLGDYINKPSSLVGKEVDFAYKPKSSKVAQFDVL